MSHSIHDRHYRGLLLLNYAFLFLGSLASTLLSKFYFVHRGSSRWVATLVQSAGFPLLLPPIFAPLFLPPPRRGRRRPPFLGLTHRIFYQSVLVGVLLGVNNLLISWGNSYLPVSTSSLLLSSQLAFTLLLSVLLVKQKVTFSNLNCVVLLTLSSLLLALSSTRDRPPALTRLNYTAGVLCTVAAGLLFALYLPLMERLYAHVTCYAMVMEMQAVMEVAATALALAGMAATGGFAEMAMEARRGFDLGPWVYWAALAATAVTWQMCFLGTAGMVFLTTSITGGICMTALLGMSVVGGVAAYGDEFGGVKAVATALCVWGFCSYVYGMYVDQAKVKDERPPMAAAEDVDGGDIGEMQLMAAAATAQANRA